MANGFVTPTPPVDFDPGFVQAPSPAAEGTQTFGTSFTAKPQPFVAAGAPTGGFAGAPAGSFAPVGPGQSATSTVPTVSDVSASSDSGLGTAAAVGGGAALAALLSRQGSDGSDGGGIGFSSIIGGAQKVYKLAEMAGKDLSELLPEGLKDITELPQKAMESVKEFFDVGTDLAGPQMSGDLVSAVDPTTGLISGHSNLAGPGGTFQGGLTDSGTLVEMGGITPPTPPAPTVTTSGTTISGVPAGTPIFSAPGVTGMFPGAAASTAALPGAGALTGTIGGTTVSIPSMGGALAGVTSAAAAAPAVGAGYLGGTMGVGSAITGAMPAAAAGASLMGAIPVLGLVAFGAMRMAANKDPTADARSAQMIENDLQRLAKKTGADKEAGLEEFEEKIWDNPGVLNLMNKAANGGDLAFGAKATSGGTKVIGYSPNISNFVKENQERLQAVVKQKEKAYETVGGDKGTAPPPNPYRKKKVQIDEAAIAAGMMDDPRKKKKKDTDPGTIAGGGMCLLNDMKVMLKNNNLINVNKLKVGDEIRTNSGTTVIEDVLTNHMREGYYILNDELKITNDHPLLTSNNNWKKTEDVLIGDFVNGIRIDTSEYIFESTPTVSIVTQEDNYNVYCDDRHYTVHGNYALLFKQAA